ncbi:BLUF domain-containing protein [Sphingomonas sp. TDK1]|uniref:BLUF domain-containing protein n=1 Tax=Sphingomonas sp. TDK1 TaxID=453247 RepID=UPI0007D921F1|nr:BLUF domain-containing protein [Sphingomonas sp. TDK1]OAN67182.1 activator of photopigment and puc with BLUF domain protein [Sphingomonas sp. TDK1]
MLQLVYVSSANPAIPCPTQDILTISRRNNARDRITGLLYADAGRFLQALEGPEDAVEAAYARIRQDPRHGAIVLLSRQVVDRRAFGHWEMAHRAPGADAASFLAEVERLTTHAAPGVRDAFGALARTRIPA